MPAITTVQTAFAFLLARPEIPYTRWDELVASINRGCEVKDVNENITWVFEIDEVLHEIGLSDARIAFYKKETGCVIFRGRSDLPPVSEILDALVNENLGELLNGYGPIETAADTNSD